MKTIKIFVVAVVILSSFPLLAQQADAKVQQSSSAAVNSTNANQSADAQARANRRGAGVNGSASGSQEMRPVQGELVGKVDAKSARPGDPVVFKTTEKTRTADGVEIPKGSRIVGHVTEVQAHGKGSEDSRLGLQFDRVELKNGQSMAIHSAIESVTPPAYAAGAAGAMDSDGVFGPAPMSGGVAGGGMAMGGARSGGGLVGGGGGGLVGGAGSLAGGGVRGAGSMTGNAGAAAGQATGSLGTAAGGSANGALGRNELGGGTMAGGAANGMLAPRSTGIPGLTLAGTSSGSASGMLSASRKNVHLDSGTQMVLGISSAGSQ
ncbi:MAG TPA: hypothetical protein VKB38_01250 [Terracidiphilus sp.]|nr:hypothetical protein [Terracidiphilus sp.]